MEILSVVTSFYLEKKITKLQNKKIFPMPFGKFTLFSNNYKNMAINQWGVAFQYWLRSLFF